MASRTLNVAITGDSRDLQRAMGRAGKSTADFEKRATLSSKATGAAFRTLAGVAGVGAVAAGLRSTVKAAQEAQVSQSKMEAQLKALNISYRDHASEIDNVIQKTSRLSGLDDEDLQDSFTNIVRTTGDVSQALKLTATAADLARTKHMDVASAGQLLAKVAGGQTNALKRLIGIGVDPVTKAQDKLKESTKHATAEQTAAAKEADKQATITKALALVQQKTAGQAEAYGKTAAGAQDRFRVSVENLQEKLGNALLPTLTDVAGKAAKFVDEMTNGTGAGGRFAKKMEDVFKTVKDVVGVLVDGAKWLGRHPGLLKAAAAAWVTYKTAAIAQIAIVKAAELGLFGAGMRTKLAGEAGKTGTLAGRSFAAKAGLAAAAGIAGWELGKLLRKHVGPVRAAGDWIGTQYGKAFYGSASDWVDQLDNTLAEGVKRAGHLAFPGPGQVKPFKEDLRPKTGRGKGGPRGTGRTSARTSSTARAGVTRVRAGASSTGAGVRAFASSGSVTGDTAGLNGDFLNRLRAMSAGTGTPISVTSGFRTAAEQQALVNQKGIWSPSNPQGAAPVGSSMHEKGLAADISPGSGTFGGVAASYGLAFTVPGEPWHIQPVGATSGGAAPASGRPDSAVAAAKPKGPSAYERLEGRLEHIDLLAGAGVISGSAADQRKISAINKALPRLHGDNRLRALGTRRELRQGIGSRRADRRQAAAENRATAREARTVDRTLSNPWLTAALQHIDNMVAAGQMSEAEGKAAKAQILTNALNAPKGLTGEDRLVAQGMVRELTAPPEAGTGEDPNQPLIDAQNDAAEAARQMSEAVKALTDEMAKSNDHAAAVRATTLGAAWKIIADVISGQIAGPLGYQGRAATAGAGSTYRL